MENNITAKQAARLLLDFYGDDASKWTQTATARDVYGIPTLSDDSDACSWCAVAALSVIHELSGDNWIYAAQALKAELGVRALSLWNDSRPSFAAFTADLKRIAGDPAR